jgi:hypothetical protein
MTKLDSFSPLATIPLVFQPISDLPRVEYVSTFAALTFKETVSRDFRLFHKSSGPRPLVNTLKYFRILGDIRPQNVENRLRAMQHSAESQNFRIKVQSKECCIARMTPRYVA